jgi:hypothetical protein
MAPNKESSQLPLEVNVSSWNGVLYRFKRIVREFRYTPFVQVLTHALFWVNLGVIGGVYGLMSLNKDSISSGIGVVFIPGSRSQIPVFVGSAVRELSILPYVWYGMMIVLLVFTLVSMVTHSFGRNGLTTYLLAISLILLLLMAKIILMPLLLIGG